MARLFALPLVLAIGLCFAVAARAEVYRLPRDGAPPAFTVNAPSDWKATYDPYGNLQLISPEHAASLQVSMINDPQVDTTPADQVAAQIFKSAGAAPYTRTEPASITGRPGQAFVGVMTINGMNLDMRVVLVKLDARHYACLTTIKRPDITPAQAAVLQRLVAQVTLSGP